MVGFSQQLKKVSLIIIELSNEKCVNFSAGKVRISNYA
ncbi:hypothetical protein RV02_GL000043 [Enterococcus gilvus]|nr:hypothetical protein RV02_GL000043 [Enterococcus gilvus]